MDWIVIEGVKPWDGRYEFDNEAAPLTYREWGWIKRLAGYLPLTVNDGLAGGDPELFTVLALIALCRAGRIESGELDELHERFLDTPFETDTGATIRIESDEESDARPPAESSNGSSSASGSSSSRSSESRGSVPSPAGIRGSATSESESPRSAS